MTIIRRAISQLLKPKSHLLKKLVDLHVSCNKDDALTYKFSGKE